MDDESAVLMREWSVWQARHGLRKPSETGMFTRWQEALDAMPPSRK